MHLNAWELVFKNTVAYLKSLCLDALVSFFREIYDIDFILFIAFRLNFGEMVDNQDHCLLGRRISIQRNQRTF